MRWNEQLNPCGWAIFESFLIALIAGLSFHYGDFRGPLTQWTVFAFAVGFAAAGIGLCLSQRWAAILLLSLEGLGAIALTIFVDWQAGLGSLTLIPAVVIPGWTALEHLS